MMENDSLPTMRKARMVMWPQTHLGHSQWADGRFQGFSFTTILNM